VVRRRSVSGRSADRGAAADRRAEARFLQRYSSPSYSDVVRKSLQLIEDGDDWRIVTERAETP
jgi:hypothetical protein